MINLCVQMREYTLNSIKVCPKNETDLGAQSISEPLQTAQERLLSDFLRSPAKLNSIRSESITHHVWFHARVSCSGVRPTEKFVASVKETLTESWETLKHGVNNAGQPQMKKEEDRLRKGE